MLFCVCPFVHLTPQTFLALFTMIKTFIKNNIQAYLILTALNCPKNRSSGLSGLYVEASLNFPGVYIKYRNKNNIYYIKKSRYKLRKFTKPVLREVAYSTLKNIQVTLKS